MRTTLIVATVLLLSLPARAAELTPAEESWVETCVRRLASESDTVARGAERALSEFGVEALPTMVRASKGLERDATWDAFDRIVTGFGRRQASAVLERLRPNWPAESVARLDALLAGMRAETRKADPAVAERVAKELEPFRNAKSYSSGDPRIRRIIAMGREAVPVLLGVLREPEPSVGPYKMAAADALSALAREEDLPALARILADGTLVSARCFAALRSEKARAALLAPVRKGMMDHDLLDALRVHRKHEDVRRELIAWIEKHGAAGRLQVGQVAEFLADAAVFSAVPALRKLPRDARMDVRRPVAQALARLGDKEALHALIEIFAELAGDSSQEHQWHLQEAGEALNRIVVKRIYAGTLHPAEGAVGNAPEAAEGFRDWWEENEARLVFQRKYRRWKVMR